MRACSRPTCNQPAVASLTYDYEEATAVLGPLPAQREPHAFELCDKHATSFTAPRGWQVIRLATNFEPAPPSPDDLLALAEAVREVGRAPRQPAPRPTTKRPEQGATPPEGFEKPQSQRVLNRRANFRVVEGGN
ncbi:MAG: DUF3499 domain-containing protein [Actinomycetaceae bacterium]|nr:DUF3499 domain-containing protein [Actinomycetaceae bacterium]